MDLQAIMSTPVPRIFFMTGWCICTAVSSITVFLICSIKSNSLSRGIGAEERIGNIRLSFVPFTGTEDVRMRQELVNSLVRIPHPDCIHNFQFYLSARSPDYFDSTAFWANYTYNFSFHLSYLCMIAFTVISESMSFNSSFNCKDSISPGLTAMTLRCASYYRRLRHKNHILLRHYYAKV